MAENSDLAVRNRLIKLGEEMAEATRRLVVAGAVAVLALEVTGDGGAWEQYAGFQRQARAAVAAWDDLMDENYRKALDD